MEMLPLCGQQDSTGIVIGTLSLAVIRPIHSTLLGPESLAGAISPTMTPRVVGPKLEIKVPSCLVKACHPDETQRHADLQTTGVLFSREYQEALQNSVFRFTTASSQERRHHRSQEAGILLPSPRITETPCVGVLQIIYP